MLFKFISETADGMGLALRVKKEGHDVLLWSRDKDSKAIGNGLVERAGDLDDLVLDPDPTNDVFVFDTSGNGLLADSLRAKSFKVVGGASVCDRLERDRAFGAEVMRDAGIQTPPTTTFTSFEAGRKFVEENRDKRLVYKPSKHLGDLSPSHVSYDAEDLLEMLENIEKEVGISDPIFDLQEFIEGTAISTEMWFCRGEFVEGLWNHTLERKELLNDNIGPSGGCTGNVVWSCGSCPVCRACRGLQQFLRDQNYIGPIDLNALVTEGGEIYGLEWTPRFGYDAAPTMMYALLDGNVSEVLHDIANDDYGNSSPGLRDGFAGGLRISIPPWPSEEHLGDRDVPVRGLSEEAEKATYFYNVKRSNDRLYTAGGWGIVACVTSHGASIGRAFSKPYEVAEALRLKDKQYRTDLVKQFKDDIEKLEAALGL